MYFWSLSQILLYSYFPTTSSHLKKLGMSGNDDFSNSKKCDISISPLDAMSFMRIVGKLKTLKRTGWVDNNVNFPESVADHMYRMSMMSFMITDVTVDKEKLMKICMVHDLAESLVGDITPHQNISKEEKRKLEEDAIRNIVTDLHNSKIAEEISSLWIEYEDGTSQEAIISRQFDKLEMIIQADEYEVSQNIELEQFFNSTYGKFSHPQVLSWAEELYRQRNSRKVSQKVVYNDNTEK